MVDPSFKHLPSRKLILPSPRVTTTSAIQSHSRTIKDLPDTVSGSNVQSTENGALAVTEQLHSLQVQASQFSGSESTALGTPLTNSTEAFFLGRYADIIGVWFDVFDNGIHFFSSVVPQLALSDSLLLVACIAASSRQHALVTSHGRGDSLNYYNQAIRLLYQRLGEQKEPDAVTFASCLLIAYCEMLESKAADWNLHLRGVREMVNMQGWNGVTGGLGQACFWVYCRMVILSCLSSSTSTPIPSATWAPLSPPTSVAAPSSPSYIAPDSILPIWANKTVHLLGDIHNFLVFSRSSLATNGSQTNLNELTKTWETFRSRLERHNSTRPSICQPLSVLSGPPTDDTPFVSVRYINGSVAAARQMFHTALLLVHLSKPSLPNNKLASLSTPETSELCIKAARKIVANSLANRSTTSWVNAVQLLTIAGMCLTDWRERKVCLSVLEDIQRITGWTADGNITELISCWGWQHVPGGWKAVDRNVRQEKVGELLFNVWNGNAAFTR